MKHVLSLIVFLLYISNSNYSQINKLSDTNLSKLNIPVSEFSTKQVNEIETVGGLTHFDFGTKFGCLTYTEVLGKLEELIGLYPNLISLKISLGKTFNCNDIWMVKISDNPNIEEAEPKVLYTAMHHAREPQGLMVELYFICYLLENYNINSEIKELIDNRELYFIPILNPDGYIYNEINFMGTTLPWRKNRQVYDGGIIGVDLNRNYNYKYGFSEDNKNSNIPSNEQYRGPYAFSEVETRMISDLCISKNFDFVLNFHAFGSSYIFPWAYYNLYCADYAFFDKLTSRLCTYNGYKRGNNQQATSNPPNVPGYLANGEAVDWMYGIAKIPSLTVEVGIESWDISYDENDILKVVRENLNPNIYIARFAPFCKKAIMFENEPNNTSQYIDGPLTSENFISGSLLSNFDIDWYYFDALQAGTITITLQGGYKNWQLYSNVNGNSIVSGSINSESARTFDYNLTSPGRYYLKVSGQGGMNDYYNLMVTGNLNNSVFNEVESNNTYTYADGRVNSGETVSATISNSTDIDWYVFDIQNTGILSLNLNGSFKNWNLYLNPIGSAVASGSINSGPSSTNSINLTSIGKYYLKFTGQLGHYDFKLSGSIPASLKESEYNDSWGALDGPVAPEMRLSGKLISDTEEDWFEIDIPNNLQLTLNLNGFYKNWSLYNEINNINDVNEPYIAYGSASTSGTDIQTINLSTGKYYLKVKGYQGSYCISLSNIPIEGIMPENLAFSQNVLFKDIQNEDSGNQNFSTYPNPFSDKINFSYNLENDSDVFLKVFDSNGRLVKILVESHQERGEYKIPFEANGLESGVYYYQFITNKINQTGKMLLLK